LPNLIYPGGRGLLALAKKALGTLALCLGILFVLLAFSTAYRAFSIVKEGGGSLPWPLGVNALDLLDELTGLGISGALGATSRPLVEAGLLALMLLVLNALGSALIYLGVRGLVGKRTEAL